MHQNTTTLFLRYALGEFAVKKNSRSFLLKDLYDDSESIGIDKGVLPDIVEILESKQVLKCTRVLSTRMPISIYLMDFGMSMYVSTFVSDIEEKSREIGLAIVNDGFRRSIEISRKLNMSIIVVNQVVDTFALKDWIRIHKVKSGDRIINEVRAGLKRELM